MSGPMTTLSELAALTNSALNERLAGLIEPKPEKSPTDCAPWRDCSDGGVWRAMMPYGEPRRAAWEPAAYCSESSPRSLLAGVLAGFSQEQLERFDQACVAMRMDLCPWAMAKAYARQLTIAAIVALENNNG